MLEAAAIWAQPWAGLPEPGGRIRLDRGRIGAVEPAPASGDVIWMPGLINAHDHGRGVSPLTFGAPDAPLEPWLWDLRRAPAADDYLSHAVAFGEMALSGITTVVHNHLPQGPDLVAEAREVARAARDVGLRLAFVVPIIDRNLAGYDGGRSVLAAVSDEERAMVEASTAMPPVAEQVALVDEIAAAIDGPNVITQYGPPGPQWLSREGWATVGQAARGTGRRVHTHLLETRPQRQWLDTEEPRGAAAFLADTGVLSDRLTVAHGVWPTADELAALAQAGAVLVLNTSSNLRLASGQADGPALAQCGIDLGLGLDGMALDDDADFWRELRLARSILGPRGTDSAGLDPQAVLRAAFSTGHRAYDGGAAPGIMAEGTADMVGLSRAAVAGDQIDPSPEVTASLILGRASRSAVRSVWIAGHEAVRDGRLTGLDLDSARAELTAMARANFAATPPDDWIAKARAATVRARGGAS